MQFPSLTGLKTRFRARVDDAARGSDVPAGIERDVDPNANAGSRERGRMRRRLRELRRLREATLLELGALVLEAHRHDRDDSPVIKRKAAEAAALDDEARVLAEALDTEAGLDTVVTTGVAGPCPTCGTLASTAARFCSTCGTPLDGRPDAAPHGEVAPVEAAELTDAPVAHPEVAEAAVDARPVDADPTTDDATTELPVAGGNGASSGEVQATTPRES